MFVYIFNGLEAEARVRIGALKAAKVEVEVLLLLVGALLVNLSLPVGVELQQVRSLAIFLKGNYKTFILLYKLTILLSLKLLEL